MKNFCGIIILFLALISVTNIFCFDIKVHGKCTNKKCKQVCKKFSEKGRCYRNKCRCVRG
uniref:U6-buthitoxin-Hj1a n=1 Tax=Hottentotta judaicus TaxID=6863 RepID=F1CIY8_HOTJU|nr:U6-buthitoxin-Hj1a [Hottentotta judaicus]